MHAQTTHTPFILLDPPPGVGHGTKDACGHAASVCQYRMYLGSRARDTAATLKQQRMQPLLLLSSSSDTCSNFDDTYNYLHGDDDNYDYYSYTS